MDLINLCKNGNITIEKLEYILRNNDNTSNIKVIELLNKLNIDQKFQQLLKNTLFNKTKINLRDGCDYNTAFIYLCKYRDNINDEEKIFDKMIEKGVDINYQDKRGNIALMYYCFYKKNININILNKLIDHTYDINFKNRQNHNALIFACKNRSIHLNEKALEILIKRGSDININNDDTIYKYTPLLCLCSYRYLNQNLLEIMMNNNANVNTLFKNSEGYIYSPLIELCLHNPLNINSKLQLIKYLKKYSTNLSYEIEYIKKRKTNSNRKYEEQIIKELEYIDIDIDNK